MDEQNGESLVFTNLDVSINGCEILHKVSGRVRKCSLLAVIGPSGAGKSTLLQTLAGRVVHSSGEILWNNAPLDKQLRRRVAFAMQEDVFLETLTLNDTLMYTAFLRLPASMSKEDKISRVTNIVHVLQLNKCLHTVVGNKSGTGLSGGERKRANIAIELLSDPGILLIDEPTTGLDSSIAGKLVSSLESYTRSFGKMLITSIHQPSSHMLQMYDDVLVMANGKVIYFGSPNGIVDWLEARMVACPRTYNPADLILQKLRENPELVADTISKDLSDNDWSTTSPPDNGCNGTTVTRSPPDNGCNGTTVTRSPPDDACNGTTVISKDSAIDANVDPYKEGFKWSTGFRTQFGTLLQRSFKAYRHHILSVPLIVQALFIALVFGVVWFQSPRTEATALERMSIVFVLTAQWVFGATLMGAVSFPADQQVYKRERAAGTYRLSAYYLAKVASEAPMLSLLMLVHYTICYWMVGFTPTAPAYFLSLSVFVVFVLVCQSSGFVLGIVLEDLPTVGVARDLLATAQVVCCGFLRRNQSVWFEWTRYLTPLYHGYEAIIKTEYTFGDSYRCAESAAESICGDFDTNSTSITGEQLMDYLGMTSPIWIHVTVLVAMWLTLLSVGYTILRCRTLTY